MPTQPIVIVVSSQVVVPLIVVPLIVVPSQVTFTNCNVYLYRNFKCLLSRTVNKGIFVIKQLFDELFKGPEKCDVLPQVFAIREL